MFSPNNQQQQLPPQVFGSHEQVTEWVQNIARGLGFVIVKDRTKADKGCLYEINYRCSKGGTYRPEGSGKRKTSTYKTNCPFKLVAKYQKTKYFWILRVKDDTHNHPLADSLHGFPYAMRLKDDEFGLVKELTDYSVQPRNILSKIQGRNPDNVSSVRTIYNAQNKIRRARVGDRTPIQVPPQVNYVGQNDASYAAMNGVPHNPLSQAESLVHSSKKLENELLVLGQNVKHHEDNLIHLTTCINSLNDQINDMQVILGKNNPSSTPMLVDGEDRSHKQNQNETVEHIMQHENSAAGVVCQLKHHADLASSTNDVLGVVATLGKVNDDNVSRILSEYLGLDTMLALVCTAYKGVEALESYDKEGLVCKNSGLHGLAASVERNIDGRFNVFCLENLRPYVGEFIPDDPQRRLALVKPKLPNGVTPDGFLGFAVNMINVDFAHLSCLTSDGHGIRETLFYTLFSRLQVYKTRAHMLQALPFLSDGAISLDGGIIRSNGVFVIDTCRDEMDVKFGISSFLPENLVDIEKKMKELKWKKDSTLEELKQGEQTLKHVRYTFEVKRQEFSRFMAQSSAYAMQYPIPATPRRPTPR